MESASFLPPHFRALYTVFCTTARGHCAPCSYRVRRNRARLCEDDATNPPHEGDVRTKFRKCHDTLQRLTKRRYSWFDKRSPLLAIANINLLYWPLGKERGTLTWNYAWGDLVTLMLAFDSHKRDLMNDDDQIPLWSITTVNHFFNYHVYNFVYTECPGIYREGNCKVNSLFAIRFFLFINNNLMFRKLANSFFN